MRSVKTAAILLAMTTVGLVKAASAGGEDNASMQVSPRDARAASAGPAATFTGDVNVTPLFDVNAEQNFSAGQVSFEPCARSAWHTHPGGQTLIVTSGSGWVQEWGGVKQVIEEGDVIWTPPGVAHWHGATEDTAMTHIAIQTFVDGRAVDWLDHVTDGEYFG